MATIKVFMLNGVKLLVFQYLSLQYKPLYHWLYFAYSPFKRTITIDIDFWHTNLSMKIYSSHD